MLARTYRLPSSIKLSFPRSLHTQGFILKYSPGKVSHARCSVVVSKKVDKRATKRNALRRCLIQEIGKSLKILPTLDILIILKPTAVAMSNEQLRNDLQSILAKQPFV